MIMKQRLISFFLIFANFGYISMVHAENNSWNNQQQYNQPQNIPPQQNNNGQEPSPAYNNQAPNQHMVNQGNMQIQQHEQNGNQGNNPIQPHQQFAGQAAPGQQNMHANQGEPTGRWQENINSPGQNGAQVAANPNSNGAPELNNASQGGQAHNTHVVGNQPQSPEQMNQQTNQEYAQAQQQGFNADNNGNQNVPPTAQEIQQQQTNNTYKHVYNSNPNFRSQGCISSDPRRPC
ncbi:MAG: hypothetical protein K0R94_1174 [Burkholderiales bacterium]|jgi:hypothetical protein|nr:hypothetical protein [Burkholderiales bacterium]